MQTLLQHAAVLSCHVMMIESRHHAVEPRNSGTCYKLFDAQLVSQSKRLQHLHFCKAVTSSDPQISYARLSSHMTHLTCFCHTK